MQRIKSSTFLKFGTVRRATLVVVALEAGDATTGGTVRAEEAVLVRAAGGTARASEAGDATTGGAVRAA